MAGADGRAGRVTVWQLGGPAPPRRAGQLSFGRRSPGEGTVTGPNVVAVRFAPVGRTLAVQVFEQYEVTVPPVSFWDLSDPANPTRLGQLPGPAQPGGQGIAFAPAGTLLAVRDDNGGGITLWDTSDPARPARLGPVPASTGTGGMAFSPDGTLLAAGGQGGTTLWQVGEPTRPTRLGPVSTSLRICPPRVGCSRQDSDHLDSVQIAPDGRTLALGSCDGHILLYDIATPDRPLPLGELMSHTNTRGERCVQALAFAPEGDTLAAANADGTTTLWNLHDPAGPARLGEPLGAGRSGSGYAVAFSPDGNLLVTGSAADSTILVFDVRDPARAQPVTDLPTPVSAPPPRRRAAPSAAGVPRPAAPGLTGLDMSSPITARRIAWLKTHERQLAAMGIRGKVSFIGRYVSVGAHQKQDRDLSRAEVKLILGGGYSLAVFQRALANGPNNWLMADSVTGQTIGRNAVANARTVGLPRGMQIFLDIENINPQASHSDVAGYCNAWAAQVRAGGYSPGLYFGMGLGENYGLTGTEFDGLAVDRFWRTGMALPVPTTRGFAAVQFDPPLFELPLSPREDPAFQVDVDVTQPDLRGDSITLLSPS
jgi:DNA-binding beta-propeller fold protein YncE